MPVHRFDYRTERHPAKENAGYTKASFPDVRPRIFERFAGLGS
jgi:hypothetical protein